MDSDKNIDKKTLSNQKLEKLKELAFDKDSAKQIAKKLVDYIKTNKS